MMYAGQKKLLSTVTFQGIAYNIALFCQMDGPMVYSLLLIKGDWQAANPEIIGNTIIDDTDGKQAKWPEPRDYVDWAAALLQTEWAKIEGGAPVPVPETWTEKLEAFLLRIAFFRNADGTHTIRVV